MLSRLVAAFAFVSAIAAASPASAAIWAWGCIGKLGDETVYFNRYTLIQEPTTSTKIKLRELTNNSADLQTEEGIRFDADDVNSGFIKSMGYRRPYKGADQKLVLTEISSRITSDKEGRVGPRDEYTTLFKKTYRYALDGEPEHKLTMDCIEYMLSTKGGRQ